MSLPEAYCVGATVGIFATTVVNKTLQIMVKGHTHFLCGKN